MSNLSLSKRLTLDHLVQLIVSNADDREQAGYLLLAIIKSAADRFKADRLFPWKREYEQLCRQIVHLNHRIRDIHNSVDRPITAADIENKGVIRQSIHERLGPEVAGIESYVLELLFWFQRQSEEVLESTEERTKEIVNSLEMEELSPVTPKPPRNGFLLLPDSDSSVQMFRYSIGLLSLSSKGKRQYQLHTNHHATVGMEVMKQPKSEIDFSAHSETEIPYANPSVFRVFAPPIPFEEALYPCARFRLIAEFVKRR